MKSARHITVRGVMKSPEWKYLFETLNPEIVESLVLEILPKNAFYRAWSDVVNTSKKPFVRLNVLRVTPGIETDEKMYRYADSCASDCEKALDRKTPLRKLGRIERMAPNLTYVDTVNLAQCFNLKRLKTIRLRYRKLYSDIQFDLTKPLCKICQRGVLATVTRLVIKDYPLENIREYIPPQLTSLAVGRVIPGDFISLKNVTSLEAIMSGEHAIRAVLALQNLKELTIWWRDGEIIPDELIVKFVDACVERLTYLCIRIKWLLSTHNRECTKIVYKRGVQLRWMKCSARFWSDFIPTELRDMTEGVCMITAYLDETETIVRIHKVLMNVVPTSARRTFEFVDEAIILKGSMLPRDFFTYNLTSAGSHHFTYAKELKSGNVTLTASGMKTIPVPDYKQKNHVYVKCMMVRKWEKYKSTV